jgi:hypothetical protein
MKETIVNILAALVLALLAGSVSPAAAQQRDCLSRQDIQDRLTSGKIAPLADVMNRAGIKERPLSVQVCDVDGAPHYIVNMMDSYGESQSVTLNAGDGSQ